MLHAIGGNNVITPYGVADGIGVEISPNLMVPPAPPNLLVASNTFSNAAWNKLDSTVATTSVTPGPGGATPVWKLAPAATTAEHYLYQTVAGLSIGDIVAASIYFKPDDTYFFGQLSIQNVTQTEGCAMGIWADPAGLKPGQDWGGEWGTSLDYVNGGAEAVEPGWCRVWVAAKLLTVTSVRFRFSITSGSFLGNPAKGLYIFGAQLEKAQAPGLYKGT